MISTLKAYFDPSIISIVALRFLQIFFGYDFGYFEYRYFKIKLIAKLACLVQSIHITYVLINSVYERLNEVAPLWYIILVIALQYNALVFVLILFPADATLSRF